MAEKSNVTLAFNTASQVQNGLQAQSTTQPTYFELGSGDDSAAHEGVLPMAENSFIYFQPKNLR